MCESWIVLVCRFRVLLYFQTVYCMYVNNVFIKNVLPQNGPSVFVIGGNKEYVRYYIILN